MTIVFHWVDTKEMLADLLTKVGADVGRFHQVLEESKYMLRDVGVEMCERRKLRHDKSASREESFFALDQENVGSVSVLIDPSALGL